MALARETLSIRMFGKYVKSLSADVKQFSSNGLSLTVDIVVSADGTASVVVTVEDSIVKLTLNRRLLICRRTPTKFALLIMLPMAVLGTLLLLTINPGDRVLD